MRAVAVLNAFDTWALLCVGASIFLGASSIAAEIASKALVVVLTRPVARWEVLAGKWAGVTAFACVSLIFGLSLGVGAATLAGIELDGGILALAVAQSAGAILVFGACAVALMLELGFDPRTTGHDSGTALHLAAWEGSVETVAALLRHPDARQLVAIKDAHYDATPLGWCCHGSQHGNASHDHAGVARLLLGAGAEPGADTDDASPAVRAVIGDWRPRAS